MQSHSGNILLDIWGAWIQGIICIWHGIGIRRLIYLRILRQDKLCLFPLYPLLVRIFGTIIGYNFYLAGLIISNVSLLVASVYLFKLVELEADKKMAFRAIKYLFYFQSPLFFGVFAESLFVALAIICFYYAKKERWFWVGLQVFFWLWLN